MTHPDARIRFRPSRSAGHHPAPPTRERSGLGAARSSIAFCHVMTTADSELRSFSIGTISVPGPTPLRFSLASSRFGPTAQQGAMSSANLVSWQEISFEAQLRQRLTRHLVLPRGSLSRQLDRGSLGFERLYYIVRGDDATIPQSRYSNRATRAVLGPIGSYDSCGGGRWRIGVRRCATGCCAY